jgi:tight adherence protein C
MFEMPIAWDGALVATVSVAVAIVLLLAGVVATLGEARSRQRALDLPPPAWRHVWRLVGLVSVACRPLLGAGIRQRLGSRLRRAGLEYAVLPEEWVAATFLAMLVAGALGAALGSVAGFGAPAAAVVAALVGGALPQASLADRIRGRRRAISRQLPFLLDLVTLGVESGLNPPAAIAVAVGHAPAGAMRDELARVLRDIRAGRARNEALRLLADRTDVPGVASFVAAMASAERQGIALAPLLRAQAEQRRSERFLLAEKRAMEAPVKLLLPLIVFIFPGTFAVLLFPIAMQLLEQGLF